MQTSDNQYICFRTNFTMVIIEFIIYFAFIIFITGCMMMFFSMRSNISVPLIVFAVCCGVLGYLIIERFLFLSGTSTIDCQNLVLSYKKFFGKQKFISLTEIKGIIIESVVSNKRIIIYNIIIQTETKDILIGNETEFFDLKHKITKLTNCCNLDVHETIKMFGEDNKRSRRQILKMLLPLAVLILISHRFFLYDLEKNTKFLIVIFISIGYLVYYLYRKNSRR